MCSVIIETFALETLSTTGQARRVKNGFYAHSQRCLHHAVGDCWDSQRPLLIRYRSPLAEGNAARPALR